MSDELMTWLRATIEGDKAASEAAEAASPGPWVNSGQAGLGDAWQIHGAPTEESGVEWNDEVGDVVRVPSRVATLNYEDGGGVWAREAAEHIVLQQPMHTIARCEVELAILDLCERERAEWPGHRSWDSESDQGVARAGALEDAVRRLAYGYRHRPGWREEWKP
ncbi:DUF6221 family protein [Microbispora sp. ATCC PTA-5024]|uniref:DUF6221 family protein n=1 Tax=Microbispora sp. ATCC PTA-5024 TaxID=316330 RepID=UPI0003DBF8A3|nr:DUF6221 family protein [Microbispora sp. ATCC PTA-5024]ETK36150.1 hypothetical protein MPTA5024_11025 [Microbispora sp. ATCC PTA-5024]